METKSKKNTAVLAGVLTIGAILAIGINIMLSGQQASTDKASLKSQSAALEANQKLKTDQGIQGGPPMAMAGGPFKDLNLTPDQQTKLDALMKDMPRPDFNEKSPPDMEKMQASFAKQREKISEILTPEQRAKFESFGPPGGMGPGGMVPGGMRNGSNGARMNDSLMGGRP